MITYAEAFEEPFDWNAFLNKKEITDQEWDQAINLANDWVTCACGNQCEAIPRNDDGAPEDFFLRNYGMDFCEAISARHIEDAKDTLFEIERRSAEILQNLKDQRP